MEHTQTNPANEQEHAQAAEQALEATQENLDTVRDILFGAQLRQQDGRFHELEAKLEKSLGDAREESRKRLDALEAFVKKEINSLVDLLKAESGQRQDAVAGVAQQLKETTGAIEKRIAGVDEQHVAAERALRQELLDQSKTLRDEQAAQGAAISAQLEKTAADLKHAKTDRAALSSMFSEMAARIGA